jgi:cell division protease FtsH
MVRLCARVDKRRPMAPFNGFGKRQPSDRPPVLTPSEESSLASVSTEYSNGASSGSSGGEAAVGGHGAGVGSGSGDAGSGDGAH